MESRLNALTDSYDQLSSLLKMLSESLSVKTMIPLSRHGYVPGHLIKTNEITISLGDGWFIKVSSNDAQSVIQRRLGCTIAFF